MADKLGRNPDCTRKAQSKRRNAYRDDGVLRCGREYGDDKRRSENETAAELNGLKRPLHLGVDLWCRVAAVFGKERDSNDSIRWSSVIL
jgi:hypothetical protein